MSRHQTAGRNRYLIIANTLFEDVLQFKYLGTTVTDQNFIQEAIMRGLNFGNICYHLGQNFLLSHARSENLKIRIKNYNFAFVSVRL
jgi:hypothetical protein